MEKPGAMKNRTSEFQKLYFYKLQHLQEYIRYSISFSSKMQQEYYSFTKFVKVHLLIYDEVDKGQKKMQKGGLRCLYFFSFLLF